MTEPQDDDELTPEQEAEIAKCSELLLPGAMELVRLYGEVRADELLHDFADMFVGSFMVALVATGIVDDPREQENE